MINKIDIQELNQSHVIPVILLAQEFHTHSNYAPLDFDVDIVSKLLAACVLQQDGLMGWAAVDKGTIIGGLIGRVTQSFFGKDSVSNDLGLFVSPDRRGGVAAIHLLRAYKAWAKAKGAKRINFAVTAGINAERTAKFITTQGFKPVGSLLVLED